MTSILEEQLRAALDHAWVTREAQTAKQVESGKVDTGTRGSVTGGAHLHALATLIGEIFVQSGIQPHSIKQKGMELPGRLISDGLYDAACFVTTSRIPESRKTLMTQPDPALSIAALAVAITRRIAFMRSLR